jgi:hypothetical protein
VKQTPINVDFNGDLLALVPVHATRHEDRGLDRSHICRFARITIDELFRACGFTIVDGRDRILDEPHREAALAEIQAFAQAIGADPELAASDATPLQYVVRAMPV